MLKLTVCNLSWISFRFTLSLFLLSFFFGGGVHLKYLGLQGGVGEKISNVEGGHYILQLLPIKSHQPPLPHKKMNGPLNRQTKPIITYINTVFMFLSVFI